VSAVFGAVVFCGAFLLFLAEPIIAKELLPWFGGAANVWATCLVFFQIALLLGYGLADALAQRLTVRAQQLLLALAAAAGVLCLPLVPAAHWKPSGALAPVLGVLGALTTTVGLPYALMATTSPLIQSWYARSLPGRSPYRLFALSNLASMLALLCYPALLEPRLGTQLQARVWSVGYGLWALLLLLSAQLAARAPITARAPGATQAPGAATLPAAQQLPAPASRAAQLGRWAAFAALGSFLLIAVTNHLTRDVAAIPLLWVLPLAVYLLTFIVSFQEPRWLGPWTLTGCALLALGIYGGLTLYTALPHQDDVSLPVALQILLECVLLGTACFFCHGTLARSRPAPRYLTRFYLAISAGGALGSLVIGIAAPALLHVDFDLQFGMLALLIALLCCAGRSRMRWLLAAGAAVLTVWAVRFEVRQFYDETVLARRNFYGALRVQQWDAGHQGLARSLSNGVILHGTQYFAPAVRRVPTEYYAACSGIGRALAALQKDPAPHRIGVIGLGVGTLAAYGRRGDVIRFYEINPAVLEIAHRQFSYLADSAARIELAMGDARLSLEREPAQGFDVLVVDAFSSDAIPVHLLTREALEVYLRHMKPAGVIAFHTSNRYVDLLPVVERLAETHTLTARLIECDRDDQLNTPSSWVLLSRNAGFFAAPEIKPVATPIRAGPGRVWSDDFSDLIDYLQ